MRPSPFFGALSLILLVLPRPAAAWQSLCGSWSGDAIYDVCVPSAGSCSSVWSDQVQWSMARWNAVLGSPEFRVYTTPSNSLAPGNGRNEVGALNRATISSLIRLMGLDLETPDHTTLSRRGKTVEVPLIGRNNAGALHLVIDSTGLKIIGGGQWNANKHGVSKERRQWRKLHLGVDLGGFIVVSKLTTKGEDDGRIGVELLDELNAPVASFRADGAYDTRPIYAALDRVGTPEIDIAIPPRRTASSSPGPRRGHLAATGGSATTDRRRRPSPMAQGIGSPPAGARRERDVSIQAHPR